MYCHNAILFENKIQILFVETQYCFQFAEAGSVGNPIARKISRIIREDWVTDVRSTCGIGLVKTILELFYKSVKIKRFDNIVTSSSTLV